MMNRSAFEKKWPGIKRFAFLGESSSLMFLFAVGEVMPQTLEQLHGVARLTDIHSLVFPFQ